MPFTANAGFFDFIAGNQASAQATLLDSIQNTPNSQTMSLLQANVSSAVVLKNINSKSKTEPEIEEGESVNILSDNALMPTATPVAVGGGVDFVESLENDISVYVVRKGDSVAEIAEMFGVSADTVLAANDMKKGDKLTEGDVLVILPISGVEHTIAKGQTLQGIANIYKVGVQDILDYNDMSAGDNIVIGSRLFIPGAGLLSETPTKKPSTSSGGNYYQSNPVKGVAGYFINPVPTGRKTQGLHGAAKRGVDIGAPIGTPIYASASGTVLIAKTGWSGGYGNMVIVQHPNGTRTLYAHMSKLGTKTGAKVSQGEVIGYVGSTGRSTGPHLHFEVFNAKNPGGDWSWKK